VTTVISKRAAAETSALTRVLFRVDPVPFESPRGYLCRVAHAHGYDRPSWLTDMAGVTASGLGRSGCASQIARALRLELAEWRSMSYARLAGTKRSGYRSFMGQILGAEHINIAHARACPYCLRERAVSWAIWDLALVTACPRHKCVLLDRCPLCKEKLSWNRPDVQKCACGMDLGMANPQTADTSLLEINSAISHAAGFMQEIRIQGKGLGFPAFVGATQLDPLLRLIRFLGSIQEDGRLRSKQRNFAKSDLRHTISVGIAAATLLRDWPDGFRQMLKSVVLQNRENIAELSFRTVFGNFYRHLFEILPREGTQICARGLREICNRGLEGAPTFESSLFESRNPWELAMVSGEASNHHGTSGL
jgi:hypothetical protein